MGDPNNSVNEFFENVHRIDLMDLEMEIRLSKGTDRVWTPPEQIYPAVCLSTDTSEMFFVFNILKDVSGYPNFVPFAWRVSQITPLPSGERLTVAAGEAPQDLVEGYKGLPMFRIAVLCEVNCPGMEVRQV
jgi:hypothetical protein